MIDTLNALDFKYHPDVMTTRDLLLFLEFYRNVPRKLIFMSLFFDNSPETPTLEVRISKENPVRGVGSWSAVHERGFLIFVE